MDLSKNILFSDNGMPIYSPELVNFILCLKIPERIYLKTAREFDDRYIINAVNRWTFNYSGSRRYLCFKQDDVSNQLTKYFCFKYASTRFPTHLPLLLLDWKYAIDYCRRHGGFSLVVLRNYLEKDNIDSRTFYSVSFGLKILCAEEFPGFTLNDYEDLAFIPRPHSQNWGIYQEIDNVLDPFEKNMIIKGLFEFLGNSEPAGSVFSKYKLLEDDGTPTQMRTHIPRHNINTFLAIAEVSDHLQAMLMGRVDITQNRHYQHLALAERRKAASLISFQSTSTALATEPHSPSVKTPLDIVKHTGHMVVTESTGLDNNIKANLHTFDDRNDVVGFIEASFADGLFEDIAAAFEEISNNEGLEQATEMVERHAVLHPLKFGSCTRAVNLWGCPYRLKCQSVAFCEHFTLTGRIDELPNLFTKKQVLLQSHAKLTQLAKHQTDYQSKLAQIEQSLQYLDAIQSQWCRKFACTSCDQRAT